MKRLSIVVVIIGLGLAACGKIAPLEPAPGHPLPVKPLMARTIPTPEELLTPPTYADPERVDELIKRSQPRRRDRFDLPPPDGGAAPVPVGSEEPTSSEEAGPVTPQ
ncbi:MAG: hypothetical protein ABIP91_09030 [Sphingomicrobium sp.]